MLLYFTIAWKHDLRVIYRQPSFSLSCIQHGILHPPTLYQERAVFGKMKMDPAKRAQTQNAGEVSSL